jgi:GT2 family glycosyltransferase/glycosyltransferase involved in cell wall biosynthesis
MRILLIVHGFPPNALGGAEVYAEQQAAALAARGDEVHVLAREQDASRPEYALRTERRDRLSITWVNNTFAEVRTFEASYRNPPIARIAARVIDEFRPDVAHVHHLTCLSTDIPRLLAARRVPVVLTLHDYWLMCHRGQLLNVDYESCDGPGSAGCGKCAGTHGAPVPPGLVPLARRLALPVLVRQARRLSAFSDAERRRLEHMRAVCADVTRFLAPSASIRDRFVRFGLRPERIELWPYGFPRFAPRERDESRTGLRIGFLGTLMVSKAPHILLDAFTRLPPGAASVHLFGAPADYHGDASYRARLAPLLRLPGVHVHGPQQRDRLPEALSSIDVLVVPSIWPETSPLVIREAFLAAVPVVASNIGGIPEAVAHEHNGLLFPAGDVDALSRSLERLLDEPGLLTRLSAGAAATPVRSADDDAAATRRLYEALLGAGDAAATARRRLSAVILNFRTAPDTAIAVSSLLASNRRPDEIIVVDNDGDGAGRAALAPRNGQVTYLPMPRNLGFPGGMNAGIRRALDGGADEVLIVNSDVVLPPDCIGRLESALTDDREAGIVGPVVLSRAAPDLVGSCGIDYNRTTGRMRHRGTGAIFAPPLASSDGAVAAVSGCLMLVRRDVFERIGLLDERYFFGFEDIDFCLRARAAGIRTRLVPGATVYHEGSRSIGGLSPQRLYFATRNHLLLARAHADGDGALARRRRALFVAALNLAYAVKAPGGSLARRMAAALHGLADHLRGRYGPGSRPI